MYANQVLELLDELKIDKKINLVGLSNGGRIVSKIAENNYEVCNLILDLSTSYEKLVRKKKAA